MPPNTYGTPRYCSAREMTEAKLFEEPPDGVLLFEEWLEEPPFDEWPALLPPWEEPLS